MKFEKLILMQSKSLNQDTTFVFTVLVWLKKIRCEQNSAQVICLPKS